MTEVATPPPAQKPSRPAAVIRHAAPVGCYSTGANYRSSP